jgi:DNA-binding transcriptional regulator GbsR (MarR family)
MKMKKEELLKSTQKKIDEINVKIRELKSKISDESEEEIKERAESAVKELEGLRDKIQDQYDILETRKEQVQVDVSEAEKNIYSGIETFDDAFTRAGSIFKTNQ